MPEQPTANAQDQPTANAQSQPIASSVDQTRALYDRTADDYARMMDAEIEQPLYDGVLSRLAQGIAAVTGPLVDTSCGSGHMLARYHAQHEPERGLVGVDLSPRMVAIAQQRLGAAAQVSAGDMRTLAHLQTGSAAAVLSFFALHHIAADDVQVALAEWHRVLAPGGMLSVAVWEGAGTIDYGGQSDVVAFRYTADQLRGWAKAAGFSVGRCEVAPVEDMGMDAVYLEGTRP